MIRKIAALLLLLALAVAACDAICTRDVLVDVETSNERLAATRSEHRIAFVLRDGTTLVANLPGTKHRGRRYLARLDITSDFGARGCVERRDIAEVRLMANGKNGWLISSINVSTTCAGDLDPRILTTDESFDRWVDSNGDYPYDAQSHLLTRLRVLRDRHIVNCGYGISYCECRQSADECEFDLEIDEIRTFTRYQILPSGRAITVRGTHGVIFYIDDNGNPQPVRPNRFCSDNPNCTEPQFVDGKTYRLAISVNGQIPGPEIIVHEDQTIIVNVKNNITTEGISVHWHGMHQRHTPFMDGVGQVTQCQIDPSSSYQYIFKASPSGTFWYHSHTGGQRTDGFFGALIVRESDQRMNAVQQALEPYDLEEFEDLPAEHSITLLDWQEEASIDLFTQINSALGFYIDKPFGEVPTSADTRYLFTHSYDNGEVGPVPYFSGLINGRGRHENVPYNKTRLTTFNVEQGETYRFRLIGAQGLYAYRFSIDGHKLTVVGTDGYWISPVQVDFIIIHTGERYDFLLNAEQPNDLDNYWIRAETLEVLFDSTASGPPYPSLGHVAEAILRYTPPEETEHPPIPSTEYEGIKNQSPERECTMSDPCSAVNCPFENFHPSYYIDCINVNELSLLLPTPPEELPNADPDSNCQDCTHFLNFNFEGESETSGLNGRNFILPAHPPQTQHEDFFLNDNICDLDADCNPSEFPCMCTHVRFLPFNETIQLIFSAVGVCENAHPIHLHGHTFHVVYTGYPEYDATTGAVIGHNTDIGCADENCTRENCVPERCTRPFWSNRPTFTINETTVRKDTVIVPAGGYVVANIISDNPGYWFFHCHIEVHQLEGMTLIFNEASGQHNPPPNGLNKCGDFAWDTEAFEENLEFEPSIVPDP